MKSSILVANHRRVLKRLGFDFELDPKLSYSYQKITEEQGFPPIVRKIAQEMPDDIVQEFMLIGGPKECVEHIDKFRKAGATQICLVDVLGLSVYCSFQVTKKVLELFHKEVIPHFTPS